jgi:D-alanyl-D-alanine carboxypeptidase/D-alanyl-D-alanine-endopeptidase (penicillin-binding protein 4)
MMNEMTRSAKVREMTRSATGVLRQAARVFLQPGGPALAVLACAATLAFAHQASAQSLPVTVAQALQRAGVQATDHGTVVLPLEPGPALVLHNASTGLNPASTMKLVTTHAVLDLLRPQFRWNTSVHLRGSIQGDVLVGDLVLRGSGDPKLVIEDLRALIGEMRAQGLREIRGRLVIDDSLYELDAVAGQAIDADRSQPYNVTPHAALMNFKAVRLTATPAGGRVLLSLDPPLGRIELVNDVRPVQGPCTNGVHGLQVTEQGFGHAGQAAKAGPAGQRVAVSRTAVRVSGAYSLGCGEQSNMVAVLEHREFIEALFAAAWEAAGGHWDGEAVIERHVDPGLPLLARWQADRTLADVVRDVNKFSNNVMARHLMLQAAIGPQPGASTRPASLERARLTLLQWLERRGLRTPELVIDNGSGLSRRERISAESLARILIDAARGEHAAIFIDSLPIAGEDGTMRNRLRGDPVAGQAWIKTGSLNDVRSIAGYVRARSGRMYAVVMLVNGPRAAGSGPAQDALLRWVHAHG